MSFNFIKNIVKFAYISLAGDDSKIFPHCQIKYNLVSKNNVPIAYSYGSYGNAPAETPLIVFNVNGDSNNQVAFTMMSKRKKGLKVTEYVCGNPYAESEIFFDEKGNITVTSPKDVTVNAGGNIKATAAGTMDAESGGAMTAKAPSITADTPTFTITGNLIVGGYISAAGGSASVSEGGISTTGDVFIGDKTFNTHKHTTTTSGNPTSSPI